MDDGRKRGAPLAPLDAFAPPDLEAWRALARAELGLTGHEDVEAALARETGAPGPALALPEHARGAIDGTAARAGGAEPGWLVAVACDATGADALADDVAREFDGGATAVWLRACADIARVGSEALASLAWLATDGGARGARTLLERGAREVVLGADPCARRARLGESVAAPALEAELLEGLALAADAAPRARGLLVDASPYHEAGAGAALELGALLAALVDALERAQRAGADASAALARVALRIAVGQDLVEECAKLRAARVLVRRVAAELGVELDGPWIHAVAARRSHSTRDPWVNLLRSGASAIAAVLGGADAVTTEPHDALIGASAAARRVARNLQLVLAEEAHLGRVLDPLCGSYAVEAATARLAREGWERFRALQQGGGLFAELESGAFARRIEADHAPRARALVVRRRRLAGVTASPAPWDPSEAGVRPAPEPPRGALRPVRDAEPFERIARAARESRAEAPLALVLALGKPAEHRERTEACRSFFQTAALDVQVVEAPADANAAVAAAGDALARRPAIVCLSASDERLAGDPAVVATAGALHARGERVWAAGVRREHEAPLRAAGVQLFLRRDHDVLAYLEAVSEAVRLAGAAR